MSAELLLGAVAAYFLLLAWAARASVRNSAGGAESFFLAGRQAPWLAVAVGMVGASLSGVTFISVPGDVGETLASGALKQRSYFQIVLGYLAGYAVIAFALLPLYYRLGLASIYGYLGGRFGPRSRRTGAAVFLVSRLLGAAARLYLGVAVLQELVFDGMGVPFALTAAATLAFILLYTAKGGMQTILWTDVFQTAFMAAALLFALGYIALELDIANPFAAAAQSPYGQIFFFDWDEPTHFVKMFLGGALIAVVMTGLDQDMMQKNLACRSLRDAQKNVLTYSVLIAAVNFVFLTLGALLYVYADRVNFEAPDNADYLFPALALEAMGPVVGLLTMLGLVASTYSSVDGSINALTASFTIDLLDSANRPQFARPGFLRKAQAGMAALFFMVVLVFRYAQSLPDTGFNIISAVLALAAYTYGPLLGLFAFGILTRRRPRDAWIPYIAVASPAACYALQQYSSACWGYPFGVELIAINGLLTFAGALIASAGRSTAAA